MNTTQLTQPIPARTSAPPKVIGHLEAWAGWVTAAAWIFMVGGVLAGIQLFVNGAKSAYNYSTLGMALTAVSLVSGLLVLMLAAWARAWVAWAISDRG